MKLIMVLLLLLLPAQSDAPWNNPQPGNPGHNVPPSNYYCKPPGPRVDQAHECKCERKCIVDDQGNMREEEEKAGQAKCKVWCFKDHCSCPSMCP